MNKALKWVLILFGALIALIVIAVIVLPMVIDVNQYKPQIEAQVAKATGRDFRLGGDLEPSVFPWIGIRLSDLHLGNPTGFKEKDFVSVESFEVRVKLLPLLSRTIQVKRFVVNKPVIVLERRKDGKGGWEGLGPAADKTAAPEAAPKPTANKPAPEPAGELPIKGLMVGEFAITDGRVVWLDEVSGVRKEIKNIDLVLTDVSLDKPIGVVFSALADAKPVKLDGTIGPLGSQPGKRPLPLDLALKLLDALDVRLSGRVDPTGTVPTFDLAFTIPQFSPRTVMAKLEQPLPLEPADAKVLNAVALSFGIKGSAEGVAVSDGKLSLDDTTATFTAKASEFDKPNLKLDMHLDQIDVDRYLPVPVEGGDATDAQQPTATDTTAKEREAKQKTDYGPLRRLVLDARFDAGRLTVKKARLQNLVVHVTARNGIFTLDPMKLDLYSGSLAGTGRLDVRKNLPATTVKMKLDNVQAGPLIKDLMDKELIEGIMAADVGLDLVGDEPKMIRRTLGGNGDLRFTDGAIVGVDLASMVRNVQTAFGADQQTTATARTDFSELQMPFTITKGVFNTDGTRLVSPLMRIQANGSADLAKETLDFRVEPTFVATIQGQGDTVDRSGIMVPVLVSGSFAKPTFKPDMAAILNQKLPSKDQVQEEIKKLIPADKKERKKMLEEGVKNLLKGFGTN